MTNSNQEGILLESGTNEFEIVEFTVGDVFYGINVAKVREIINPVPVTMLPGLPACVDGIVQLRGRIISLVNLGTRLASEKFAEKVQHIIICEFNQTFIGFLVNDVLRIHRISWEHMEPLPQVADEQVATGIIKMDNKLIVLLDFEQILTEISPEIARKLQFTPKASGETMQKRTNKKIVVAEDSKMLRELLCSTLTASGYSNLVVYENGKAAWDALEGYARQSGSLDEYANLVITDIEMPQMDGHHLIKRIKAHDKLRELPVFIFSSLINEEMRRKGAGLGAAVQISKPEIALLIDEIDKHIL